jgi:hypothetical protein
MVPPGDGDYLSNIMQNTVSDRRLTARYTVRVPITVMQVGTGSTLDMSASGIGFLIDGLIEPGLPIEFELALAGTEVLLHCDGRVVRVEKRGPTNFTAATIENIAVKPATEH